MVDAQKQQSPPRFLQLAVDICAAGSVLSFIVSMCLLVIWLTTPYAAVVHGHSLHLPETAVEWLLSLPVALTFFLLALVLLVLCTILDSKLPTSHSEDRA
jgi:hypothetical protein